MFQTNEEIGEIYQDEENQAAVLLRNEGDDVIVVSHDRLIIHYFQF